MIERVISLHKRATNNMRIYIRHAEKAYKNGKPFLPKSNVMPERAYTYAHDPPLTRRGRKAAKLLAEELLRKYPTPVQIITSPYLRTRETAIAMAKVVVRKCPPASIKITCQEDISEYLGNHVGIPLDVSPSTGIHRPPHPENFYQFRNRIKQHYISWDESSEVTWVITHGIVITEILRPFVDKRVMVPYLGYIVAYSPYSLPELYLSEDRPS